MMEIVYVLLKLAVMAIVFVAIVKIGFMAAYTSWEHDAEIRAQEELKSPSHPCKLIYGCGIRLQQDYQYVMDCDNHYRFFGTRYDGQFIELFYTNTGDKDCMSLWSNGELVAIYDTKLGAYHEEQLIHVHLIIECIHDPSW